MSATNNTIKENSYTDQDRKALNLVLNNRAIFRKFDLKNYNLVRSSEKKIRKFFKEKAGLNLIVNPDFIKLEKNPCHPIPQMGIESFKEQRDYVLLSCIMAFLEEKSVEEQFLLGNLTENIVSLYPFKEGYEHSDHRSKLDWTSIAHRRSLVRVLNFCIYEKILREVDGLTQSFSHDIDHNVLYETTPFSHYFLISYPKDLTGITNQQMAITKILEGSSPNENDYKRFRIYRNLLLNPAYNYSQDHIEDLLYLKNQHKNIKKDFAEKTGYTFEMTADMACLTLDYRSIGHTLFPNQQTISDIILLVCNKLRKGVETKEIIPKNNGLLLTHPEWYQLIYEIHQEFSHLLGKTYLEMTSKTFAKVIEDELVKMDALATANEGIQIRPILGRFAGRLPKSITKRGNKK